MRHAGVTAFVRFLALATAVVLPWGGALHAGSTGSSGLLTPQGDDAGTSNGDYVSDSAGLDDPYHFWIEVPSGVSRLVVELFDADVGDGPADEDDDGRDRDRGGGFTTSADYEIFDPSGAERSGVRYRLGDNTGPTGSDNAWLTFYELSSGNSVRDNFGTAAYTNNDGTANWAGNWTESDSNGGGATGGDILITGGELRLGSDGDSIFREADLLGSPGLNLGTAFFRFDFDTSGNLEDGEGIVVEVSANGGGSWTTLETFSNDSSGSRSYNITGFIANNTRIRFTSDDLDGSEFFFLDNVRIEEEGALTAGHWEVRVTMNGGNDINALGVRAHDGTSGAGGTELNVYADSAVPYGVNPDPGSNSRSYDAFPYITSGCTANENDFDYDSNSGTVGSIALTRRTGTLNQTIASGSLASDNVWNRDTITAWTSDSNSTDYGIWSMDLTINTYAVGGSTSGNYTVVYVGNSSAAANPPTANPQANTQRIYLPTDANAAPVKAYLEQMVRHGGGGSSGSGPNPPQVGQQSIFTVTVVVVNPEAHAVTFSATNLVTANVPGSGVTYGGDDQVSQGTITAEPAVGGTGNITWNPGTVAAGATALMSYEVRVTPASNGQRLPVTGTGANGTRATFLDITGNTSQARATFTLGGLCELAVTEDVITQAVVSSFRVLPGERGGVVVEWTTASEAGTAGFRLFRRDPASKRWAALHRGLLAGLQGAPQGGTYRFVDEGAQPGEALVYRLEEVESTGRTKQLGPYRVGVPRDTRDVPAAMAAAFERDAHAAPRTARPPAAQAPSLAAPAKANGALDNGSGLWLGIDQTGLYSLSVGELAEWFGVSPADVRTALASGKLSLRRGDSSPVAWHPDYPTNTFGPRGVNPHAVQGIFFYAVAEPSLYSRLTAYRLELDVEGVRMESAAVAGAAYGRSKFFVDSRRTENDAFAATVLPLDPASDYWFWAFVMAGDPVFGEETFAVEAPGATASGATLYLDLQGATSGAFGNHDVAASLNGVALAPIGGTTWADIAAHRVAFAVPAGVLQATGNQLQVTAAGTAGNIFYVDGFELSYARRYSADGDRLTFTAPANGGATVSGFSTFSNSRVYLLDVGSPEAPPWAARSASPRTRSLAGTAAPGGRHPRGSHRARPGRSGD
jgi:hypothetical protein